MLEKMDKFFEARLDGYEEHMLTNIESAETFYPITADCLPDIPMARILDLGCGTGLELNWYFRRNPTAKVTGIDLSEGMLAALRNKFLDLDLTLICGSYFDIPFGEGVFDAAVSVESLHHFTQDEKISLYARLCKALKENGYFILTDYFSMSDEEEHAHRQELYRLKDLQGIHDNEFYHYDTPLTVVHETEALLKAGFSSVEVLNNWGATFTIKAYKRGENNMIEAIAKRKSIRSFADKKVEAEKVESILRAAMRAPSGINGQPWEFIVVDDREVLTAMQKLSPGGRALQTAPLAIVVLEKEIPFRIEKGFNWLTPQDLAACTENILLQAVEEGLGAGWMGVGPGTPGQTALAELLGLPENIKPYSIVGIGYPAEDADLEAMDRFDPCRIHYNKY